MRYSGRTDKTDNIDERLFTVIAHAFNSFLALAAKLQASNGWVPAPLPLAADRSGAVGCPSSPGQSFSGLLFVADRPEAPSNC